MPEGREFERAFFGGEQAGQEDSRDEDRTLQIELALDPRVQDAEAAYAGGLLRTGATTLACRISAPGRNGAARRGCGAVPKGRRAKVGQDGSGFGRVQTGFRARVPETGVHAGGPQQVLQQTLEMMEIHRRAIRGLARRHRRSTGGVIRPFPGERDTQHFLFPEMPGARSALSPRDDDRRPWRFRRSGFPFLIVLVVSRGGQLRSKAGSWAAGFPFLAQRIAQGHEGLPRIVGGAARACPGPCAKENRRDKVSFNPASRRMMAQGPAPGTRREAGP